MTKREKLSLQIIRYSDYLCLRCCWSGYDFGTFYFQYGKEWGWLVWGGYKHYHTTYNGWKRAVKKYYGYEVKK